MKRAQQYVINVDKKQYDVSIPGTMVYKSESSDVIGFVRNRLKSSLDNEDEYIYGLEIVLFDPIDINDIAELCPGVLKEELDPKTEVLPMLNETLGRCPDKKLVLLWGNLIGKY